MMRGENMAFGTSNAISAMTDYLLFVVLDTTGPGVDHPMVLLSGVEHRLAQSSSTLGETGALWRPWY